MPAVTQAAKSSHKTAEPSKEHNSRVSQARQEAHKKVDQAYEADPVTIADKEKYAAKKAEADKKQLHLRIDKAQPIAPWQNPRNQDPRVEVFPVE